MEKFVSTRVLLGAGAVYALAAFFGGGGGQGAPDLGAPAAVVAAYAANHGGVKLGAFVEELALVALVVFVAALSTRIRLSAPLSPLAGIVLAGGVLAATVKFASFAPAFALYTHQQQLQPDVARALFEMNGFAFVISWFGQALVLLGVCAAGVTSRAVPTWLAATGGVIGVGMLIDAGLALDGQFLAVLEVLWLAWTFAAGVSLAVWGRRSAPSAVSAIAATT